MACILTPELRLRLKKPLGMLIKGSFDETTKCFKEMVEGKKQLFIITVGDAVTKNFERNGISPSVSIIDNRIMREKVKQHLSEVDETVRIRNPQSTITEEATLAVTKAIRDPQKRTRIIVDGEEDLLTLIGILEAPENAVVVYGQPREGIVVVEATCAKKREISEIVEAMKCARKTK